MRIIQVIESKRWKNKLTGASASAVGAHPSTSKADDKHWEVVAVGWTWERSNGCVGLGRKPAATRNEAIEVMNRVNERSEKC